MKPIEEQGYLIPALNTDSVDYVTCAIGLARSIRKFHPDAKIAVMTLTRCSDPVFDHVVPLPHGDQSQDNNMQCNDWQVFYATPFRETIKLEADMLVASSIDQWWTMLRHKDVVISQGARTIYDQPNAYRGYRKIFDENHLPDVYNAVTYWRLSSTAQEFFTLVKTVFENWSSFRTLLKFPDEQPSTDLVYAVVAQIMGPEQVTLPQGIGPSIVHMKSGIQPCIGQDWRRELVWEIDPLRVQTVAQWGFFHYYHKDWQP